MATPSPKPTLAPFSTPRSSLTTLSRSSSRRGCVQSLLPLQSAVSSARLTSCDSKGTRSLSQPLQTREFCIFSSRRLLMGPSMTLAAVHPYGISLPEVIKPDPESHLHPLFAGANTQRANMGDNLIGEEHLVIAYSSEIRFGTDLFEEMYLLEDDLKSAVQAIRSNLKKKEEDATRMEDTKQGSVKF